MVKYAANVTDDRTERDKQTILKDKADTPDARYTDDVKIDACNANSYSTRT